jgi:membrane-associated protease RseP (regulator of RpoE activity)
MIEVPFELVNDHVFVRASVNGVPADLIVDTGSSVSSLSEGFAARHGAKPFEGLASVAGAARMPVRLATVRRVSLPGIDLGEAIAFPSSRPHRNAPGHQGAREARRGSRVVRAFAAPGKLLFLLREAARASRYDASGLTLTSEGTVVVVDFVAPRSPAAEAWLEPGDIIEKIDGREVAARDLPLLRRALREAGTTRVLHVRRLGSVPIALRTLV